MGTNYTVYAGPYFACNKNATNIIPYDIESKCDERIYLINSINPNIKDFHIYCGNIASAPGLDIEPRSDFVFEKYDGKRIDNEIENFKNELASELIILEQIYGTKNVTINWGIITLVR